MVGLVLLAAVDYGTGLAYPSPTLHQNYWQQSKTTSGRLRVSNHNPKLPARDTSRDVVSDS